LDALNGLWSSTCFWSFIVHWYLDISNEIIRNVVQIDDDTPNLNVLTLDARKNALKSNFASFKKIFTVARQAINPLQLMT